jgi:hypothetical protein
MPTLGGSVAKKAQSKPKSAPPSLPPYVANQGQQFSFLMSEDFLERINIAWRVETAQADPANPLVEPKYEWDGACVFLHGAVLVDPADKLWKAWYLSKPLGKGPSENPAAGRILTYAESEDGVHWTRPELDIALRDGKKTNILLDLDSGGLCQHPSIILHPDAPPDYRYEMFLLRYPEDKGPNSIVRGFPLPEGETKSGAGVYRYHSADGKRWQPWEKLGLSTRDSILVHQVPDGTYRTFYKGVMPVPPGGLVPYDVAVGECRYIVVRTSEDGTNWSGYEPVITPDWMDAQDTQFMELDTVPEKGGYIGTLAVYHLLTQTIDIQFAASRDGKRWWRPDRRPCVPLDRLGNYGGGMIWPLQSPFHHDGRLYFYYAGCDGLHADYMATDVVQSFRRTFRWPNYPTGLRSGTEMDAYSPNAGMTWFHSAGCRASWKLGRLWAAVTASGGPLEGMLGTKPLSVEGKQLRVNAQTIRAGSLQVELLEGKSLPGREGPIADDVVVDEKPIPGFSRADCTPFTGDSESSLIKWKGGDRVPAKQVRARFYLSQARLYSFDWE